MSDSIFFSPSTYGAYTSAIHGSNMPHDVVEVQESVWQDLLAALAISPKKMGARADGYPILIDPPEISVEQQAANERAWRDSQLSLTDALVSRHRDEEENALERSLDAGQYKALQVYRQELRDWPQAPDFPVNKQRPAATMLPI